MHVKKLRLLQKKGDDIPHDKAIEKTRKYLTGAALMAQHAWPVPARTSLPRSPQCPRDRHHAGQGPTGPRVNDPLCHLAPWKPVSALCNGAT